MATRKHCIASIFMSCSVFMSVLGRSIDNDSAALKSHIFMAFRNLLKDEDTSGVAKGGGGGGARGETAPNCPKTVLTKSQNQGRNCCAGGGVYILSTESQLHLYDENQFTWNY